MSKGSLGLLIALLALGIIVNVQQGGAATTATLLGYAPLAACLVVYLILWAVASRKK